MTSNSIQAARFGGVFLLYAASGWVGLSLATYGNAVTLIWPPTGVAMFALLAWGPRLWPAIWLGALAVSVMVAGLPAGVALAVATGNTVGPLMGALALRRMGFSLDFSHARDALLYVGIGALGIGLVTSINGSLVLMLAGIVPEASVGKVWLTWWMGDAVGALIVGPALLALQSAARPSVARMLRAETLVAWGLLLVTLLLVSPLQPFGKGMSPFLAFPFVVWLALRGRIASASWAVLFVSTVATWGAMTHGDPFSRPDGTIDLPLLWSLMATLGATSLLVSAMRNESAHALKAAIDSEKRFHAIIDVSPVPFALQEHDGRIGYLNPAFVQTFGYTLEDIPTLADWRMQAYPDAEYRDYVMRAWRPRFETMTNKATAVAPLELVIRCKDGSNRTVLADITPLSGLSQGHYLASLVDITERKHAEARLRVLAGAFQHGGEAIMVTDRTHRIVEVNAAFERMTGYTAAEVSGLNPHFLASGRTTAEEYRQMRHALDDAGFWKGELWDRHKDGNIFPVLVTISTIRDDRDAVTQYVASYTDITERKAYEERISFLAHHDALTKLPNRLSLQDRLEQALATARRDETGLAILLIDLDNFKTINDTLGHNMGDGMLIEVARRLRDSVRDSDIVARLGGDEFVVVLTETGSGAVPVLAGKLLHALARSYSIDGYDLNTTPSIGISVYPEDGDGAEGLIKNADVAMYHAKSNGRNNFQFFTQAMNTSATERMVIENSLRQALERHQFLLHFQPQIEVKSGRLVGVEALVRWQHPERGMIGPDRFIPVAEESGLILPLGAWVMEAAIEQLAIWEVQGLTGIRMAVNLSARQLRDHALIPVIEALLARHGVRPSQLELEITESAAMDNADRTAAILVHLRAMGIGLAIDDFGTGYSSLSYLKQLPVGTLKIDRSFVMDIERDENDAAICTATISLAHSLGLAVIAEGVETLPQLEYLKSLGCDQVQGYYFSKPLPAPECEAFIRRSRAMENPLG